MVTVDQIVTGTGANIASVEEHFVGIIEALEESAINTPLRVAHFIAQCAHESALFSTTEENLNYS